MTKVVLSTPVNDGLGLFERLGMGVPTESMLAMGLATEACFNWFGKNIPRAHKR